MRRAIFPTFVEPITAKVVHTLPDGPEWLYKVKLDGNRALLLKNGGRVYIRSPYVWSDDC